MPVNISKDNLEMRDINSIRPYWNNPREISDKAVNAVKASIDYYGYKQPIVIDKDGIIVSGHVRYKALRKLGVDEVLCVVANDLTDDEVREFRIADNKTNELTTWDDMPLSNEIKKIPELEKMEEFFNPHTLVNLASNLVSEEALEENGKEDIESFSRHQEYLEEKQKEIDQAQNEMEGKYEEFSKAQEDNMLEVECPFCGEEMRLDIEELKRRLRSQRENEFE